MSRLAELVQSARPDFVFHLAAKTNVTASWDDPTEAFTTNVLGTIALLEAVRAGAPEAVVQIVGSALEYGPSTPDELPITETRVPRSANPYGLTKFVSVELGRLYALRYGMRVHAVRPFQFIGPRKYPDACSHFARGIVAVERGELTEVRVGNLEAVRDYLDVHDGVRAMWLVARTAEPGDLFNVCSGIGRPLRDILRTLMTLARVAAPVIEDPQRLRPLDVPIIVGDNSKLRRLGWEPEITIDCTLAEILDYWRASAN
jgi:GDP-4-dehydro-6-deoxy-D-mannose reductase